LLIHERRTRRQLLLSRLLATDPHYKLEPNSQDRGRNLATANTCRSIVPHDFTLELDIHDLTRGCFHPRIAET
jgi:hypothetical protein